MKTDENRRLSTWHRDQTFIIDFHRWLKSPFKPMITDEYQWFLSKRFSRLLSVIIDYHRLSSIIIDYNRSLVFEKFHRISSNFSNLQNLMNMNRFSEIISSESDQFSERPVDVRRTFDGRLAKPARFCANIRWSSHKFVSVRGERMFATPTAHIGVPTDIN
jgi:hypothetical protein